MGWKPLHKRMKQPPCKRTMARHVERVAGLPCPITGKPAVIHHIMHCDGKYTRRDDRFIVPLSPEMHNMGPQSVHALGGEAKFMREHTFDLVEYAKRLWAETTELVNG